MTKEKDYIRLEASTSICANCESDIKHLSDDELEKFSWYVPDGEFENGICELHCSIGCKDATDYHFKWLKRNKDIALDKNNNLWYFVKKRDTRHPCLKENCRFYDRIDNRGNYFYCGHLGDYLDKETGICPIKKSKLILVIKYCPHCKKEIKDTKKDLKDLIRCPKCRNFFYSNYQLLDKLPDEKPSGWGNVSYPDDEDMGPIYEEIIFNYENNIPIPLLMDDGSGVPKEYAYEKVPESAYLDAKEKLAEINGIHNNNK